MADNSPTARRQGKPSKLRASQGFRKKNRKTVRYTIRCTGDDSRDITRALRRTRRVQPHHDISENEFLRGHLMQSVREYLATPEIQPVPPVAVSA